MAILRTGMRAQAALLETTDIMERIEEAEMATIATIGTTIMEDRGVIIEEAKEVVLKMTDEICLKQWAIFRLKVSSTFSMLFKLAIKIFFSCRKGCWSPKT